MNLPGATDASSYEASRARAGNYNLCRTDTAGLARRPYERTVRHPLTRCLDLPFLMNLITVRIVRRWFQVSFVRLLA